MRPLSWRALLGRIRHILLAAVAVLAVLAATAQTAGAADYHAAIRDCNDDGVLQGHYSLHTLRQAKKHLPASLQEYSDCADVLARAIAAAGRGGSAGGGSAPPLGNPALTTGSGAVAPNIQQKRALEQQAKQSTRDTPPSDVTVGGQKVLPGAAGLSNTAVHVSTNDLPAPLLILLIALAATAALATALVMRQRWPETRRVALRIFRR
jgi:hypothetical protein